MTATEEARDLALLAADAASGKLATDIVLIDVSERLAITDVFLIASGNNERQVEAIVDAVEEKLRAAGRKPLRREGRRDGRWVLLDYADIVIHIQHTEERVFYALERLWKDCAMISIDPRGGGSTDWVQPSAARTAARSAAAAGADAGALSLGQTVATAAAADDVAALEDDDLDDAGLHDDDLDDNLDDLTDDELAVLVAADVSDIDDDGAADNGVADGDLADDDVQELAGDDLDDLDDPGAESDLGDTQAADGDAAGLGRIGFE